MHVLVFFLGQLRRGNCAIEHTSRGTKCIFYFYFLGGLLSGSKKKNMYGCMYRGKVSGSLIKKEGRNRGAEDSRWGTG